MKSEAAIRKHRDTLRDAMKVRCGCAGTIHELECFVGMKMMTATSETLSWVLGENEDMNRLVETMDADVKRRILEKGDQPCH